MDTHDSHQELVASLTRDVLSLLSKEDGQKEPILLISKVLSQIMTLIQSMKSLRGPQKKALALAVGRKVIAKVVTQDPYILHLYDEYADEIVELLFWTSKHLFSKPLPCVPTCFGLRK